MRKVRIAILLLFAVTLASCFKDADFDPVNGQSAGHKQPGRLPSEETRRVMIMYSAGFNSLSSPLSTDLEELEEGFVPLAQSRGDNILLVFSRLNYNGYGNPVAPVLYRLYKDREGAVVKDTLLRWKDQNQACDPAILNEVMTYAREKYPARGYGLVFSSHGSGWLPANNSSKASVKSVGQDADTGRVLEMELHDFVRALPYKLDYVIFDACFMGCVEVAWALREKAGLVGFSPTEIMSDGFNYLTLAERLIGSSESDVLGVCHDFFAQYTSPEQKYPYATITLVDPGAMQPLADVSKTLFERYRTAIAGLTSTDVQRYYRKGQNVRNEHLFDLRDMVEKAGASASEMEQFDAALKACVLYEAHTKMFMTSLPLIHVCGLSVYLPSSGDGALDTFYKTYVGWNNETKLIP